MKKSIFLIILLVFIVGCDNKNVNNIKENNNKSKNSKTKIEYYCEDGYTLLNGKCVKIKETKDHSSKYTCEDGLLLDDGKCYKEEIIEAKKKK